MESEIKIYNCPNCNWKGSEDSLSVVIMNDDEYETENYNYDIELRCPECEYTFI